MPYVRKKLTAEQRRAYELFRKAVRSGEVTRKPCEVCGTDKRVHAHHEDYAKPLDVKWLCPRHHHVAHGKQARPPYQRPKRYGNYAPEPFVLRPDH